MSTSASLGVISNAAARYRVMAGYRQLFRARKLLFIGDDVAMRESRITIKEEFIKNRHIDISTNNYEHFNGLITMIDEATDMLTNGIVRGNLNQNTGHYGTLLLIFFFFVSFCPHFLNVLCKGNYLFFHSILFIVVFLNSLLFFVAT